MPTYRERKMSEQRDPKGKELMDALARWYRAHHHGGREDEALQSELLAKAYADFLDGGEYVADFPS